MNFDRELIKLSEEIEIRKYSPQTKKAYFYHITKFLQNLNKPPKNISKIEIRKYLLELTKQNYDENTLRLTHSSINFFFTNVLEKPQFLKTIPKAKPKQSLAKALSKNEIKIILNNITNEKHYLLISTIYSAGLRLSEVINLKREDLNPENNTIRINQSKQKKDRITICSATLMKKLTNYICKTEFKTKYLFESNRGKKYSKKTIEQILKKASISLNKKITPHILRHSFATHLIEAGVDIHYIQKLLGHNSIKTTQNYLKIASNKIQNLPNPFDNL